MIFVPKLFPKPLTQTEWESLGSFLESEAEKKAEGEDSFPVSDLILPRYHGAFLRWLSGCVSTTVNEDGQEVQRAGAELLKSIITSGSPINHAKVNFRIFLQLLTQLN